MTEKDGVTRYEEGSSGPWMRPPIAEGAVEEEGKYRVVWLSTSLHNTDIRVPHDV